MGELPLELGRLRAADLERPGVQFTDGHYLYMTSGKRLGTGGMGNVWGVMVGALALAWINSTFLPQMGETVNDAFGTDINFPSYNYLIFGLILVLMMRFRREGLFPARRPRPSPTAGVPSRVSGPRGRPTRSA